MTRIMLICSAGMSTSLLVEKMKKAAQEQGIECEIWATGESEAKKQMDNVDVMLLGPQVRFLKSQMEKAIAGKNIKLDVIESVSYGTMNGAAVLAQGLNLLK